MSDKMIEIKEGCEMPEEDGRVEWVRLRKALA